MTALTPTIQHTKQLFIIDKNVDGWRDLVNNAGIGVSVLLLDPSQDGLTQIADAITAYSNLDVIHILSHGSVASLQLGSATLNSDNLNQYTQQLTTIGNALSESGDLLLYGCNVAQGETGNQFIQTLAQITGADVAASDDLTGNAALGGDWVLEASTGSIEANSYNLQNYQGVLRDYNLDYLLAEMSNLVYDNNPLAPTGWVSDDRSIQSSGFAAFSFQNGNDIVIAYRGTKLINLGDLAADAAIANPFAAWNAQFTDALDFAWKIKDANKDNPNIKIYVTGHSLGGALAQVASQMFGFDGATFDPGGARNLLSTDFNKWASDLKQNHPELTLNQGVGAGFLNYLVADSLVSGLIPDHIGSTEQLDFFAYAANEKLVIGMATELASYALADFKLGFLADAVAGLLTAYALHQMDGILTLMSIKKYNQITADFQQKIDQALQSASTTGDIGFPRSTSNQGQTEFHSSKEHPYLFANDLDNIIYGYAGNDAIYSLAGNDTVYGGDGNDTISTAQGNDVIDAGNGSNTVYAGSGDDTINNGKTNFTYSTIDGGTGNDTLTVDFSTASYFVSYLMWDVDGNRIYSSNTNGIWDATFSGSYSYEQIHTALATASSFEIRAGFRNYSSDYDRGHVNYRNIENTNVTGSSNGDLIIAQGTGTTYNGGGGTDTLYADWANVVSNINWVNDPSKTQTLGNKTISGFERLMLTIGDGDNLIDNSAFNNGDTLFTGNGNDTIKTGNGDNHISTNAGNDIIQASGGSNWIDSGSGDDTINNGKTNFTYSTIDGGTGNDTLTVDFSTASYFVSYLMWDVDGGYPEFCVNSG